MEDFKEVNTELRRLNYKLLNENQNIHSLIDIRTKISGYTVYLAEHLSDAEDAYLEAQNIYEDEKLSTRDAYLDQKQKIGYSEAKSRYETIEEYKQMNRANSLKKRIYNLIKQYNEVLSTLNQRISFAKKEWELDNHYNS